MRTFTVLAVASALLAGAATAHAENLTFTTIDNPADPTFNQLLGIDNAGTIAGYFGMGTAGHPNKGYTVTAPYTTFVPADAPGSAQTQLTGITNSGYSTGFWSPTNTGTDDNFGFIRYKSQRGYVYVDVNDPLTASTPFVTQVLGVNKTGIAVGFYNDVNGMPHGFVYNALTAQYAPVNVGGSVSDGATGINNNNLVSGFFTDAKGVTHGFLKALGGAAFWDFKVPGATVTQFLGVNNHGQAVGFYTGTDNFPHGIMWNPATGILRKIDDPNGVMGTTINGLNDRGELVGFYTDAAGNTHGMLITGAP
jgi:hypothetical protein